LIPPKPETER